MVRLLFPILALPLLIDASGCNSESRHPIDPRLGLTADDLSGFRPISDGVARASSLRLYEGLPHQMWEKDQYDHELATKKSVQLHDYPFYERTLAVSQSDREELRRSTASAETYFTFSGEKPCGGYHPDYCLEWIDGENSYELLICLGCEEMKLFGPTQQLRVDIRRDAAKRLKTILSQYRDQRPVAR
jgi:hypothetical protein